MKQLRPEERRRRDTIVWADLSIYQSEQGYRFNRDSVILARSIGDQSGKQGLDLGAGCGVLSLIIIRDHVARKVPTAQIPRITGIEVQKSLAQLAQESVQENRFEPYLRVLQTDVRRISGWMKKSSVDFVVSNPPYYGVSSGRISPQREKAFARHAFFGDIPDFVAAAAHALKPDGQFFLVFPFDRLSRLFVALKEQGFVVETVRPIQATQEAEPRAGLVFARLGGHGVLQFLPPLIDRDSQGRVSEEIKQIFEQQG